MIQQPVKILGVVGDKVFKETVIIMEFYLNYWMSVVKNVVNFARCYHPDVSLLVLSALQMKTSVTAPKLSF